MQIRQMLERLWVWWSDERRLREGLAALLVAQALVFPIPQSPVLYTDTPAYTQWLAEQQPTFGVWTNLLSSLRLFTFHTSLWMRGLMVWLTWLALFYGAQAWEHRQQARKFWRDVVICGGGLLVLLGWMLQLTAGWTVPEVLAWPGRPIELPDHGLTLPEVAGQRPWWSGRYGVYLLPTGKGLAVQAQAHDAQQRPLRLQLSTHTEPQETISVPLTGHTSEAYFALPDEGYAFRVYLPAEQDTARIQAYRITSGEWLTETVITASTTLPLPPLTLQVTQATLKQFKVVYNPGALWTALGIALLLGGTFFPPKPQTDDLSAPPEDL